jgi:hypothetical protein
MEEVGNSANNDTYMAQTRSTASFVARSAFIAAAPRFLPFPPTSINQQIVTFMALA